MSKNCHSRERTCKYIRFRRETCIVPFYCQIAWKSVLLSAHPFFSSNFAKITQDRETTSKAAASYVSLKYSNEKYKRTRPASFYSIVRTKSPVNYDLSCKTRVAGLDVRRSALPGGHGRPLYNTDPREAGASTGPCTRRVERCQGDFSGKRHGIKKSIMSGV